MIYELNDTTKVEHLFAGMEDTMIRSCLQKVMGSIFVTDPDNPKSAMAFLADFAFFAGEPDHELVARKPNGFVVMTPPDESWARRIEECFPNAERATRFAIRKDTKFDRQKLERIAASIPARYAIRKIGGELYDACLASELFTDCVKHFGSKERYLTYGRGYVAVKNGTIVSAASSYTAYREGIEIEIDTIEEERRKGLASAVGATLILDCLDAGLYPSWDAANPESVRLAEKLGYTFSHAYDVYFVE